MCPYFLPAWSLSTTATMLHSSIVRIFTLQMVGSWLNRVMLYLSRVALMEEAICDTALEVDLSLMMGLDETLDGDNM